MEGQTQGVRDAGCEGLRMEDLREVLAGVCILPWICKSTALVPTEAIIIPQDS